MAVLVEGPWVLWRLEAEATADIITLVANTDFMLRVGVD